jgi:type I restriction enzyme R subunit
MPRIAATVNMIATGTDIKPLKVLSFLRDDHSRVYFEQMKGRGTRVVTRTAMFPERSLAPVEVKSIEGATE